MKALDKTMSVLELFTPANPQWGLFELGEATSLPVSTLHRIVSVLKRHGLMIQDPDSKKYRLGYAAIELGRRAAAGLPVRQMAEPEMRRLARETGETIVLTVLNDAHDRSICVDRIESRYDLRLHLEVGSAGYLHAGASSKVLLAFLPEDEVTDIVRRTGLPKMARYTITDEQALATELANIRKRGYAYSHEETDPDAWGVAAPILTLDDRALAAIGIAGPMSRYSVEARKRYAALATESCARVAERLGMHRRPERSERHRTA
jgi:DNA-binding IclR family transcriptional regulator